MLLIRRFEEKVEEQFRAGELPGFLHVAIGQEAVAVGVASAMADGDVFASTHRAHAHALARGSEPKALMAEMYGKIEGVSHGYGGSMHLYDVARGNLGANAVVGGGLPMITGAALSFKLRGEPRVSVAFFGDGATNIGTFHESLNLAQLWQRAGRLRLREQPLRRVDAREPASADRRPREARRRLRDEGDEGRRAGRRGGAQDRRRARSRTRARARGRCSCSPRPSGSSATTSATRRSTDRRGSSRTCASTRIRSTGVRLRLELSDDELESIDADVRRIVEDAVEFARNGHRPQARGRTREHLCLS